MAILNKEEGCVVLRIVYAGAPLSGKTESLRSLSGLLFGGRRGEDEFYSPDHTDGRTLYFDWLNYTGGYFKGYKVNCQLITVPGQKTLKKRRKLLLEMADVVVFVVDSEAGKLDTALNYYQEMQPWLIRKDEPPIGVVIQANKRDSLTALPIPEIYDAFQDNPHLLVLETVATTNAGIREAFVAGVRLGLERASWLINNDKMQVGASDLTDGDALLNLIQAQEESERSAYKLQAETYSPETQQSIKPVVDLDLSASQLSRIIHEEIKLKEVSIVDTVPDLTTTSEFASGFAVETSNSVEVEDEALAAESKPIQNGSAFVLDSSHLEIKVKHPALPNKDVVAGSVFPPITGRIILHKLANEDVSLEQHPDGGWEAKIGSQWRLLSRSEDCFATSNDARMRLVYYANKHKKLETYLSEHRCMAIVESEEQDEWRVWQIVRNEPTLSELLQAALMGHFPHRIAEEVYEIAENYVSALKYFADTNQYIPFHFGNIAINQNKPVFTGYIPQHIEKTDNELLPVAELVKQNFKPMISRALHENPILSLGVPYVLHPLEGFGRVNADMQPVVEALRTLFIGEH